MGETWHLAISWTNRVSDLNRSTSNSSAEVEKDKQFMTGKPEYHDFCYRAETLGVKPLKP